MKYFLLSAVLGFTLLPAFGQREHTFSFASDSAPSDWTFKGFNGNQFSSDILVDFHVDLNEIGAGGKVTLQSRHYLEAVTADYQQIPCGNNYLHIWKVRGAIYVEHYNAPGNPGIIQINFDEAVLTALSPTSSRIVDSMTLQVNAESDPTVQFQALNVLLGLGIGPAGTDQGENLAYTITDIRNPGGGSFVPIDPVSGKFLDSWYAEGSFSASSY